MSTGNYDLQINWPGGRHSSAGTITDEQWGAIARILSPDWQASAAQDGAVAWVDRYSGLSWLVSRMTVQPGTRLYPRAALSATAPNHSEQVRHMVPAWNLAADELPASGKTVLAFYLNSHGMGRRIRAMHVKRFTVEAEEFADPDTQCCEYSEQDDCYYTTEGWYELIDNWPDYSSCAVIEGVITHWMPLPAAPSAACQHRFMFFGSQIKRICADCYEVEVAPTGIDSEGGSHD